MDEAKQSLAVPNAELGKNIIQLAQEERRKRFTAMVVQIADSEMESIKVGEKKIAYQQTIVDKAKKRLAAIEAGEFTVSDHGRFQFKDEALRLIGPDDPIGEILDRAEKAFLNR